MPSFSSRAASVEISSLSGEHPGSVAVARRPASSDRCGREAGGAKKPAPRRLLARVCKIRTAAILCSWLLPWPFVAGTCSPRVRTRLLCVNSGLAFGNYRRVLRLLAAELGPPPIGCMARRLCMGVRGGRWRAVRWIRAVRLGLDLRMLTRVMNPRRRIGIRRIP